MTSEYSIIDFFNTIYRWRKLLITAAALIGLVSIVVSLLMPNYYKAETTFYAASPDLAKPIPIGDDEKDIRIYGDDNDLDRLFTIALSQELVEALVDSFDLYTHYDIDTSDHKASFKVKEQFLENYQTIKTKYGALHLMVEDKDPKIAAALANAARSLIETFAQKIVKNSQEKLISTYEVNIQKKLILSDSLSKSLERIKARSGIFDSKSQTGIYSSMLGMATANIEQAKGKVTFYKKYPAYRDSVIKYMALEAASQNQINVATIELKKYAPVMSEIRQMEQEQSRIHDQISLDKERLKQINATYGAPFAALHIVEKAQIPVQKSRPKRSILILLSILIGTSLCTLGVIIFDNFKGQKLTS